MQREEPVHLARAGQGARPGLHDGREYPDIEGKRQRKSHHRHLPGEKPLGGNVSPLESVIGHMALQNTCGRHLDCGRATPSLRWGWTTPDS